MKKRMKFRPRDFSLRARIKALQDENRRLKEEGGLIARCLASVLLDFDGIYTVKQENYHLVTGNRIDRRISDDGNLVLTLIDEDGVPYNDEERKRVEAASQGAEETPGGTESGSGASGQDRTLEDHAPPPEAGGADGTAPSGVDR